MSGVPKTWHARMKLIFIMHHAYCCIRFKYKFQLLYRTVACPPTGALHLVGYLPCITLLACTTNFDHQKCLSLGNIKKINAYQFVLVVDTFDALQVYGALPSLAPNFACKLLAN